MQADHPSMFTHFGYVVIVGRPNVGKSTLFNRLIGAPVSVVTRKAQTTQNRIIGVVHHEPYQYVMFDTPGVKTRLKHRHLGHLNRLAQQSTYEADCALFMVSAKSWNEDDEAALSLLSEFNGPVIAVINKIDHFKQVGAMAQVVERLQSRYDFRSVVAVSARHQIHLDLLKHEIHAYIPQASAQFDQDQLTTHTQKFMCVEILRAALLEHCHEEIPYVSVVHIDEWMQTSRQIQVHATIWVSNQSQKPMIIGKQGEMLKRIGTQARLQMEERFKEKIVLKTWVKVGRPEVFDLSTESDLGFLE